MIRAEEFCKRVFDGTHETPKPSENGYKLLTSKNILDGFLDKSNAYYISEEDYNSINKRSGVQTWDILFSMIGTVGNVCLIHDSKIDFAIKNMGVFSCEDEWKAKWLYFYFQSPYAKSVIKNYLNGAVQKFLPLEVLRDFPVPQFDCNKEHITKFLWSIERKLSLNRNINATLEAMAKTLYDYWFVQFDFPDEKGRPYKTSGGKMVYNEELGREIPAGWEVGNLNVIAEYINGLACQRYRPAEDEDYLPVVKIREIHEGVQADTERVSANIPDNNIIHDGDILFSWSATLEVHYWIGGKAGLNQHIFKVMPKDGFCREYVYYQLKEYVINFSKIAEARKTTMGHITQDHLDLSRIAIPPRHVMSSFQKIVCPIHESMIKCKQENLRLAALRDWLLPMLMNGQVGFKGEAND